MEINSILFIYIYTEFVFKFYQQSILIKALLNTHDCVNNMSYCNYYTVWRYHIFESYKQLYNLMWAEYLSPPNLC